MTLLELARKLRPLIEKAAISLDDADAIEAAQLFPEWQPNINKYEKDERVRYEGILYKCLQEHIPQPSWTPTATPSLWAKVLISDTNVISEWEQPGATNPYQIGDKVTHNGETWECIIANNVWEPGVYGWNEI